MPDKNYGRAALSPQQPRPNAVTNGDINNAVLAIDHLISNRLGKSIGAARLNEIGAIIGVLVQHAKAGSK